MAESSEELFSFDALSSLRSDIRALQDKFSTMQLELQDLQARAMFVPRIEQTMGHLAERIERIELLLFALPVPDFHRIDTMIKGMILQQKEAPYICNSSNLNADHKTSKDTHCEHLRLSDEFKAAPDTFNASDGTITRTYDTIVADLREKNTSNVSSESSRVKKGLQKRLLSVQEDMHVVHFSQKVPETECEVKDACPGSSSAGLSDLGETGVEQGEQINNDTIEVWEIHAGGFLKEVWPSMQTSDLLLSPSPPSSKCRGEQVRCRNLGNGWLELVDEPGFMLIGDDMRKCA